jgi:hypothetical protein
MRCRFARPTFCVQHSSEIHKGIRVVRIYGQCLHVGVTRVTGRDGFELDTELEPFVSGMYALAV